MISNLNFFLVLPFTLLLSQFTRAQQTLTPFNENAKWGFKDTAGNILVQPKYDHYLEFNSNDGANVFIVNNGGEEVMSTGFSRKGWHLNKRNDSIKHISGGMFAFLTSHHYKNIVPLFDEIEIKFTLYDEDGRYSTEFFNSSNLNFFNKGMSGYKLIFNQNHLFTYKKNGLYGVTNSKNEEIEYGYNMHKYNTFYNKAVLALKYEKDKITFKVDEKLLMKCNAFLYMHRGSRAVYAYLENALIDTFPKKVKREIYNEVSSQFEMWEFDEEDYCVNSGKVYFVNDKGESLNDTAFDNFLLYDTTFKNVIVDYSTTPPQKHLFDYFGCYEDIYAQRNNEWWVLDYEDVFIRKIPFKIENAHTDISSERMIFSNSEGLIVYGCISKMFEYLFQDRRDNYWGCEKDEKYGGLVYKTVKEVYENTNKIAVFSINEEQKAELYVYFKKHKQRVQFSLATNFDPYIKDRLFDDLYILPYYKTQESSTEYISIIDSPSILQKTETETLTFNNIANPVVFARSGKKWFQVNIFTGEIKELGFSITSFISTEEIEVRKRGKKSRYIIRTEELIFEE